MIDIKHHHCKKGHIKLCFKISSHLTREIIVVIILFLLILILLLLPGRLLPATIVPLTLVTRSVGVPLRPHLDHAVECLVTEHGLVFPVQLEQVGGVGPVDHHLELTLQRTLSTNIIEQVPVELEIDKVVLREN